MSISTMVAGNSGVEYCSVLSHHLSVMGSVSVEAWPTLPSIVLGAIS